MQKFKETGDSKYLHQNELYKSYSQHDMAYRNYKDILETIASCKIFHAKNPKYEGLGMMKYSRSSLNNWWTFS